MHEQQYDGHIYQLLCLHVCCVGIPKRYAVGTETCLIHGERSWAGTCR